MEIAGLCHRRDRPYIFLAVAHAVAESSTLARHDGDLLRRFARDGDDLAFAAVVQRHAGLVLAAARRRTDDGHRAEDVAQAAFIVLAKKARRLTRHATVGPWLLKTVQLAANNANKVDRRRRRHEQRAAQETSTRSTMHTDHAAGPDPAEVLAWREVRPILDDCVLRLSRDDQVAVTLRHFEGRGIDEVAAALNVSRDAAKQRVSRATGRLRDLLDRRGVSLATTTLAGLLAARAAGHAPAHLISAATRAALSPAAGSASFLIAKGAMTAMTTTQLKLAATLAAAGLLTTAGVATYAGQGGEAQKDGVAAAPADVRPPTTQQRDARDERQRQATLMKASVDRYISENLRPPRQLSDVAPYWQPDADEPAFEPNVYLYREVPVGTYLSAGDLVQVFIGDFPLPSSTFSQPFSVGVKGTLDLPDLGPVDIGGKTTTAAATKIASAYEAAGVFDEGMARIGVTLMQRGPVGGGAMGGVVPDLTPVVLLERDADADGGRFAVTMLGTIRYVVDPRTLEELDREFVPE